MTETVYIYGLVDPQTQELRYVGKTVDPKERLREHLKDRRRTYRNNWITHLKRAGVSPQMVVLEIATAENWAERERFWIAHYKSLGANLVNSTDGGDANWSHLPEVRRKMSENSASRRPEVKAKISANNQMRRSADARLQHSLAMKQYYQDHPEAKKRQAELLSKYRKPKKVVEPRVGKRKGHPHTPESKEKIRQANLIRMNTPEAKERVRQINLGKHLSAETRAKISASHKGIVPWNKKKGA